MKIHSDEAVVEVRAVRKALCDRFGNDPRRLLAHLRAEQRNYRGRIIKNWSELEPTAALRETATMKKKIGTFRLLLKRRAVLRTILNLKSNLCDSITFQF